MSATAAVTMPARSDRNAPQFDSRKQQELRHYFSDLEFLFDRSSVNNDTIPPAVFSFVHFSTPLKKGVLPGLAWMDFHTLAIRPLHTAFNREVTLRLHIKHPEVYPDDPYQLADLYSAAEFVLSSPSGTFNLLGAPVPTSSLPPLPGDLSSSGQNKELLRMDKLPKPGCGHLRTKAHATRKSTPCGFVEEIAWMVTDQTQEVLGIVMMKNAAAAGTIARTNDVAGRAPKT
ncbi:hypothetical protein B0H14DRAFT_3451888 [Mycena olivaceomarginata]|nr:hypothetical protein B0H14DRAFT_3451888 [Mycena olivaceomarginata]